MKDRLRGLTVLEFLVAMAILALVVLFVGALFGQLLAASAKTSDLTVGAALAQKRLDEIVADGSYVVSGGPVQELVYTQDSDTQTTFVEQVTTTPIYLPAPSTEPLFHVRVDVWWWENSPQATRRGMGKLSTSISRVVEAP